MLFRSGVFAYLLKGKIETAMTATNFAVADAEIGAAKEFAPRMAEISAKTTALLTKKRERIVELEGNKKDLEADRQVSSNQVREWCRQQRGIPFQETSAIDCECIENAFDGITQTLLNKTIEQKTQI